MSKRSTSRLTRPSPSNGLSKNGRAPIAGNGRAVETGRARRKSSSNGQVRLLPSAHFEATREALLQRGISSRSDRLAVTYSGDAVRLELFGLGVPFLRGVWNATASIDGRDVDLRGDWEAVCWNADEDADYFELQLKVDERLRIDRQILLARQDHLAILADSVLAPGAREIIYRARWPIASRVHFDTETSTRAGRLRGAAGIARVYPLALPAEHIHSTPGRLAAASRALELVQHQSGAAMYVPIVFDWSPARREAEAFWRRLTVSEARQPVPADVAAGYRLQVASNQWLIYHSLQKCGGARSVLGHHTWNESVIGSFRRNGEVAPLIVIE